MQKMLPRSQVLRKTQAQGGSYLDLLQKRLDLRTSDGSHADEVLRIEGETRVDCVDSIGLPFMAANSNDIMEVTMSKPLRHANVIAVSAAASPFNETVLKRCTTIETDKVRSRQQKQVVIMSLYCSLANV